MTIDTSKNKGIIFDVDGVLLDSMEIWTDLGARYLKSLGTEAEEGLGSILFSMSMEQGAEYLNDHYDLHRATEQVMDGLRAMLRDYYYYEVCAKPGAEELLRTLKAADMRITAATSSPREHIERALERNGLLGYIERLFTSAETGTSKHSPEIYNSAAEYMGTSPDETFVIEDSLYALRTAANAGYHTIGIFDANGESDQKGLEDLSEIYIRELNELTIE